MSAEAPIPFHRNGTPILDALYRDFEAKMRFTVAHILRRPVWDVEDGCQTAWAILARRPDVLADPRHRAWLVTVAKRACLEDWQDTPIPSEVVGDDPDPMELDTLVEARLALRQVAELRPCRRRVFERHLAGLSYKEIADEQGLTYTNVNRQMVDSRRELRMAAA